MVQNAGKGAQKQWRQRQVLRWGSTAVGGVVRWHRWVVGVGHWCELFNAAEGSAEWHPAAAHDLVVGEFGVLDGHRMAQLSNRLEIPGSIWSFGSVWWYRRPLVYEVA